MKKIGFIILLMGIMIIGCQDGDENSGSFTVTVDGTDKVVKSIGAKITIITAENSSSGQGSHSFRIGGMIGEDSLGITVSNWDFQEPPQDAILVKDYSNESYDGDLEVGESTETCMKVSPNQYVCEAVLMGYKRDGDEFGLFNFDEITPILTITKCDGKRISGSFNVVLNDPHHEEIPGITMSGTFVDVEYVVKK